MKTQDTIIIITKCDTIQYNTWWLMVFYKYTWIIFKCYVCVCVCLPACLPDMTGMNETVWQTTLYYVNKVSAVDIVINIRTKVLVTYKIKSNKRNEIFDADVQIFITNVCIGMWLTKIAMITFCYDNVLYSGNKRGTNISMAFIWMQQCSFNHQIKLFFFGFRFSFVQLFFSCSDSCHRSWRRLSFPFDCLYFNISHNEKIRNGQSLIFIVNVKMGRKKATNSK